MTGDEKKRKSVTKANNERVRALDLRLGRAGCSWEIWNSGPLAKFVVSEVL